MSAASIELPTRLSRRIEKIAREAGRTPDDMMKFVIRDREAMEKYHREAAGDVVADRVIDAILSQAEKVAALGLMFRPGIRQGTRECVMTRYPYTLVYRIGPGGELLRSAPRPLL